MAPKRGAQSLSLFGDDDEPAKKRQRQLNEAAREKAAFKKKQAIEAQSHELTELAEKRWASEEPEDLAIDEELVQKLYTEHICGASAKGGRSPRTLEVLDMTGYLERYLWPRVKAQDSSEQLSHVLLMSVIGMLNHKFRDRLGFPWKTVGKDTEVVRRVVQQALTMLHSDSLHVLKDATLSPEQEEAAKRAVEQFEPIEALQLHERVELLRFVVNGLSSLEVAGVAEALLPVTSIAVWLNLDAEAVRYWADEAGAKGAEWTVQLDSLRQEKPSATLALQRDFVPSLLRVLMLRLLQPLWHQRSVKSLAAVEVHLVLELCLDMLAQPPTRPFVRRVVVESLVLEHCQLALDKLVEGTAGTAHSKDVAEHLDMLHRYLDFPVDDVTGDALHAADVDTAHNLDIAMLQKMAYKYCRDEAKKLWLLPATQVAEELEVLTKDLNEETLRSLAAKLRVSRAVAEKAPRQVLLASLKSRFRRRAGPPTASLPVYPTEKLVTLIEPKCRLQEQEQKLTEEEADAFAEIATSEGRMLDDLDEAKPEPAFALSRVSRVEQDISTATNSLAFERTLPKLDVRFLSLQDYLLRNFFLYRLEATSQVAGDIVRVVQQLRPKYVYSHELKRDKLLFTGWSRDAAPLDEPRGGAIEDDDAERGPAVELVEVLRPRCGESVPARVLVKVRYDLSAFGRARGTLTEWNALDEHSIVFLANVDHTGLRRLRGARVVDIRVPAHTSGASNLRIALLELDPAQYLLDQQDPTFDINEFNLVVRRSPRENNFASLLQSMRELMRRATAVSGLDLERPEEAVTISKTQDVHGLLPEWLAHAAVGGDAKKASTFVVNPCPRKCGEIEFHDTFLDAQHVRDTLGVKYEVVFEGFRGEPVPPFKCFFDCDSWESGTVRVRSSLKTDFMSKQLLNVKGNEVRFTEVQSRAVASAMLPGLTLVVGPPGTGKTDVATQILTNWIVGAEGKRERTLLLAHSNQALNDLFAKLALRDAVPQRHLVRLGQGSKKLALSDNFSRHGRVEHWAARRSLLLGYVKRVAMSMRAAKVGLANAADYAGVYGAIDSTVEAAIAFKAYAVDAAYDDWCASEADTDTLKSSFPFASFWNPQLGSPVETNKPELHERDTNVDLAELPSTEPETADLFRHASSPEQVRERGAQLYAELTRVFDALQECRPFETLAASRNQQSDFLVSHGARVVAMTVTHAALKHKQFVQRLRLEFDNVLMEEAAQVMDIETLVPLLSQPSPQKRLRRVVLIGDHHQLPPIVHQVMPLEQSMFARLIRQNADYFTLDQQGRSRPALSRLWSWRYGDVVHDLPAVTQGEFAGAVATLAHEAQFVDVGDLDGQGESAPQAHFYQNLAEAESLVATYQLLRLCGYQPSQIALLTTYNGQRELLEDVVAKRCLSTEPLTALFGAPVISTVDRFQGQQADIVLLSLVRTGTSVGHLRDVRRLVVAVSRARHGLVVFGRKRLFANCAELAPTMRQLMTPPPMLQLALTAPLEEGAEPALETVHNVQRKAGEAPQHVLTLRDLTQLGQLVHSMSARAMQHLRQQCLPAPQQ
ncbi:MAG: hypothetical protein MHM6MM_003839 [Cercozoa sp. M6MM]